MDDATPNDFSRLPVEQFARFLMVSAKEDPSLLRRASASSTGRFLDRVRELPSMLYATAEPNGVSAAEPYLEELVALAVASAREAEDASQEAHAAIARARRGTFAFASVAALGVLIGAAGIAGNRMGSSELPAAGTTDVTLAAPTPSVLDIKINSGQLGSPMFPVPDASLADFVPPAMIPAPAEASAAPADPRVETAQTENPADNTALAAPEAPPSSDSAPTPAVVDTASGQLPSMADHPDSAVLPVPVTPPTHVVERRPLVHHVYRHVRYVRARPVDPVSRILTEIQWRIAEVFR